MEKNKTEKPSTMATISGSLSFSAKGAWLHEGREIKNPNIARFFSRQLRYSEEHRCYIVEAQGYCLPVEVEDTAFVAKSICTQSQPWQLLLNTELRASFDPATLTVAKDNIFYCYLQDLTRVRLLRPTMQSLLNYIEYDEQKRYQLHIDGKHYTITEE